MNNDLISREALKIKIEHFQTINPKLSVYDVLKLIDNAPTVLHDNYSMGYQDGVRKVLSERPTGEWTKDKNPDKDGDYLCISGIGTVYFRRILHFTHDLYQIDPYAFHKYRYKKKTERSGWYDIDSDWGYFEVDVHAWCELPEMPEEFRGE